MLRATALLLALGAATANAAGAQSGRPTSAPRQDTVFLGTPLGELGPRELEAIGPRVRRIRVEPAALILRRGDTLRLDSVRVVAVDAQGADLGRLQVFDRGVTGRGVLLMRGWTKAVAVRLGADTRRVTYPSVLWRGAAAALPQAAVAIRVVP